MSSKHTPGPWRNDHYDEHSTILITSANLKPSIREPQAIARVMVPAEYDKGGNIRERCEEAEANARLIAAGPMLLKTCVTALHVLDTCSCDDMSKLAADNIRAAIAAAEGAGE